MPIGLRRLGDGTVRAKVVSHYLLEKMREAGACKVLFTLRRGKWDIPNYYSDAEWRNFEFGYLVAQVPHGHAYSVDQAYPFARRSRVLFGYPDIIFGPGNAFCMAMDRMSRTGADLVLGLYQAPDANVAEVVEGDRSGRVRAIRLHPHGLVSKWTWVFAVWSPIFTEFLHDHLQVPRTSGQSPGSGLPLELSLSHVMRDAVSSGISTQSVKFGKHDYCDIGTPTGLERAVKLVRTLGVRCKSSYCIRETT